MFAVIFILLRLFFNIWCTVLLGSGCEVLRSCSYFLSVYILGLSARMRVKREVYFMYILVF